MHREWHKMRLYKLYTHHILIFFIFKIQMFCNLIRTFSDKKHSIFSRIRMFRNNHDTTALHNSVRPDGVLFSLFSLFHNIETTRGSLLEKNMDITE